MLCFDNRINFKLHNYQTNTSKIQMLHLPTIKLIYIFKICIIKYIISGERREQTTKLIISSCWDLESEEGREFKKKMIMMCVGVKGPGVHIYIRIGPGPNPRTLINLRTNKRCHKDPGYYAKG